MLVDKNTYMSAGIYIGMKTCTPSMKQFVYRIREDGLAMLNLKKIDERLQLAANFLTKFKKILVVGRKDAATKPIKKFAEVIGARAVIGRFPPGMLTNPSFKDFYEPDVLLVVDPLIDKQAMSEALKKRIPIVALCNTFNNLSNVDLVIPVNNNGRKSLALIFWILAREILKLKGEIKKYSEFKHELKDFGEAE